MKPNNKNIVNFKIQFVENDENGRKFHIYKEFAGMFGKKFFYQMKNMSKATLSDAVDVINNNEPSNHWQLFEGDRLMDKDDPRLAEKKEPEIKSIQRNNSIDKPDI